MATITGHYNVSVDSRYYAFLQDDLESAEPHVLIANAEKKRELRKENKTKAKKEKRNKQIAEIKENKTETNVEEIIKVETEIAVESKPEIVEKPIEIQEPVLEEKPTEPKYDRSGRGRGNNRRQNGGSRRGGYTRNDERTYSNDEGNHQKSQDTEYSRYVPNNRVRPYRKERSEGDNSGKIGFFEDQSSGNSRGISNRRRSSGRSAGRYSRGGDRSTYERNGNERYGGERNGYDKNGNERNRVDNDNEDSTKIDIIPENMGTFEDMSSSRPPRSNRGRFPRSNRGNFNRFNVQNNESDYENTKMGYFDENVDNREFRGGRGRSRGRGMRRGRGGEPWRRGNDREENRDDGFSNNLKPETHDVPPVEKWPEFEEEPNNNDQNNDPSLDTNLPEASLNDLKKSNWCEIEDDPVEQKPSEHMTLEEYRALHCKDRLFNQEGKENRKANDGQDVFSGMEEYRKGRFVEEQGDEHDNHENQHGRQKQSIPVSVRFSRNTEYGESNNFENNGTPENKSFSRGYYKNDNKYRTENLSAGGRGRSRGGSDFNTYGRGRDFNRGRGRPNRNSYPVKRKEDQVDGVNINLGNEEEFPTLS